MSKKTPTFEEILKNFTNMDTDEKATVFHQKLQLYLTNKTPEERNFVGNIFLSITRDNAHQLLKSIEQKGNVAMLEEMQQMLSEFA